MFNEYRLITDSRRRRDSNVQNNRLSFKNLGGIYKAKQFSAGHQMYTKIWELTGESCPSNSGREAYQMPRKNKLYLKEKAFAHQIATSWIYVTISNTTDVPIIFLPPDIGACLNQGQKSNSQCQEEEQPMPKPSHEFRCLLFLIQSLLRWRGRVPISNTHVIDLYIRAGAVVVARWPQKHVIGGLQPGNCIIGGDAPNLSGHCCIKTEYEHSGLSPLKWCLNERGWFEKEVFFANNNKNNVK